MSRTLSVLQFNAWLMAFPGFSYSDHYHERKSILPEALAKLDVDVISLQEVWRNRDKLELERALRDRGYSHFRYCKHRFGLGDGMFLASRYPLSRVNMSNPFRNTTRFIECFSAKRVAAAAIELPGVGEIDLFQTHLGSVHFDLKTKTHSPVSRRKLLLQLLEVSDFIRAHRRSEFTILTGDLNFHYQHHEGERGFGSRYADEYTRFMEVLRASGLELANSFLVANGMDESHPAVATYSQDNPYAKAGFASNPEETLDYVLFAPHSNWRVSESKVVFRDRVSERIPALSDHYGILSVFEFNSPAKR